MEFAYLPLRSSKRIDLVYKNLVKLDFFDDIPKRINQYPMHSPFYYFKQHQGLGIYAYYKVCAVPGRIRNGYQEVINFSKSSPIIQLEYNFVHDPLGLQGTWQTFENGEPISEVEYKEALSRALKDPCLVFN